MARTLTRVPCDRCKAPQLDGAHICPNDTEHFATILDDALNADWLGELATNITHQAVTAGRRHRDKNNTNPLPVDLHAVEVRAKAVTALTTWAQRIATEFHHPIPAPRAPRLLPKPRRDLEGPSCGWDECWHPVCVATRRHNRTPREVAPGETRITVLIRHIRNHLNSARFQPWAPEALNTIERALWAARATIDAHPERKYLGRCWMPTPDGDCPAEITTIVGAVTARCRGCGHVWDVAARYDWLMREVRDTIATIDETAGLLTTMLGATVHKDTIKSWVRRGQLDRRGIGVRFGDAADLAIHSLQWKAKREASAKKAAEKAKTDREQKRAAKAAALRHLTSGHAPLRRPLDERVFVHAP